MSLPLEKGGEFSKVFNFNCKVSSVDGLSFFVKGVPVDGLSFKYFLWVRKW
jgi:hypothetical protein